MKRTTLLVILIVIGAAIGVAIFWSVSLKGAPAVQVTGVELSDLHSSINTNGKVEAEKVFEIRSTVAGPVQEVLVRDADQLRAGQPILTLDDSSLQSELAAAKAELGAAESELRNIQRGATPEELNQALAEIARYRLEVDAARKNLETNDWLLQKSAISKFELEESRRSLARAQQLLEAAMTREQDLRNRYDQVDRGRATARVHAAGSRVRYLENRIAQSIIRSPATGTLYHFEIKDGAYLNIGDLVGMVADLTRLRVRAFVDEPELGRLKLGGEVYVRWDGHPSASWKGTITHIPSEVVARGTRSVAEVLSNISSSQQVLLPNVNVDVEIVTAKGPLVSSLPRNCVFPEGKDHFVWVLRDGQAVKRKVETGRSNPSVIEVTGGLALGDQVIIPGDTPLLEGMKVRVAE